MRDIGALAPPTLTLPHKGGGDWDKNGIQTRRGDVMIREELIMICTCEIAGQVRGKAFPARELPARLARGVGWTPTNIMITTFGVIGDTPFGALGDLMLLPDP